MTLPYALIDIKIAFINIAMLFYNIGISFIFILFLSTYNSTRIDLGKSQFMNYQGLGVIQYLAVVPVLGIPILIQLLFSHFGLSHYGFYFIGIIGLIAILFNKYLIQIVTNQFVKRRHQMASDFKLF